MNIGEKNSNLTNGTQTTPTQTEETKQSKPPVNSFEKSVVENRIKQIDSLRKQRKTSSFQISTYRSKNMSSY